MSNWWGRNFVPRLIGYALTQAAVMRDRAKVVACVAEEADIFNRGAGNICVAGSGSCFIEQAGNIAINHAQIEKGSR
ncbi:MAG: hypothetical protein ACK519_07115 [Sphingomonadaceae bacterium]|jgi:hypothetical protein